MKNQFKIKYDQIDTNNLDKRTKRCLLMDYYKLSKHLFNFEFSIINKKGIDSYIV